MVSRNELCPCGSGKKYKACCLSKDEVKQRESAAKALPAEEDKAKQSEKSAEKPRFKANWIRPKF